MKVGSREPQVGSVLSRLSELGLQGHLSEGVERTVIGVVGNVFPELQEMLEAIDGVDEVVRVSKPYKLSGREFQPADTVIQIGDGVIGAEEIVGMAGPCAGATE